MVTPYDITMGILFFGGSAGAIWSSYCLSKAVKEGKYRVIGVSIGMSDRLNDTDRIDWIAANRDKMPDVYWRMGVTTETTFRNAVDIVAEDPNVRLKWSDHE